MTATSHLHFCHSLSCDFYCGVLRQLSTRVSGNLGSMRLAPLAAILFVAAPLAAGLVAGDESRAASAEQPCVIELFTSQGCSSCPPADAFLGRLTKQPGIIALSFSIDYWDYLGWRDTLARPAHSERQRGYARARGDGRVYTPQMVIDGLSHANGADEQSVLAAVAGARKRLVNVKVPVTARKEGDTLVVQIGDAPDQSDRRSATVWLAIAKEIEKVAIARGENRGREVAYHHPVRELTPIGMWDGAATSLKWPLSELKTMGGDQLFVLLQVEELGPILGAASFTP